jgi:hypothetical protein
MTVAEMTVRAAMIRRRVGKGGPGIVIGARHMFRRARAAPLHASGAGRVGTAERTPCLNETSGPPLPTLRGLN